MNNKCDDSCSKNFIIIGRHFKVGSKFHTSAFTELRFGENLSTKETVVIKIEDEKSKISSLEHEYQCYRTLGRSLGIAKIFHFGPCEQHSALVMEMLGDNLEQLFNYCGRRFTMKTVLKIGVEVISRLEFIHSKKLLYRNVKPQNLLIGRKNIDSISTIHFIDFSLSTKYIDSQTNDHIAHNDDKLVLGPVSFMSVNACLGKEQSRRDDLESLGYLLLYFLRSELPWQQIRGETIKETYKLIGELKLAISIDDLCDGLPEVFATFLKYVRNLGFYDTPNYSHLRDVFKRSLEANAEDGEEFDWTFEFEICNVNNKKESDTFGRRIKFENNE